MKIVVLGGGESGCGAAYLAKKKGLEVFLSDKGAIKDNYKQFLTENELNLKKETTTKKNFKCRLDRKKPGNSEKGRNHP
jgi:UDP-N-acetylmuramoylalanine--D-glutamate ligase